MMQIFNLKTLGTHPFEEREMNIMYNTEEFKVRIIKLPPGGKIPTCEMSSYVIFNIIEGRVDVKVDNEERTLNEGQVLISEPADISMSSIDGAKIMGIQISVAKEV